MKILSLTLLCFVLLWTWKISYDTKDTASPAVKLSLQAQLQGHIKKYVQTHLPNSQNIQFQSFQMESTNATQIKVKFKYSFKDRSPRIGATLIEINGTAVLKKLNTSIEKWKMSQLSILNNDVSFQEPLIISR